MLTKMLSNDVTRLKSDMPFCDGAGFSQTLKTHSVGTGSDIQPKSCSGENPYLTEHLRGGALTDQFVGTPARTGGPEEGRST